MSRVRVPSPALRNSFDATTAPRSSTDAGRFRYPREKRPPNGSSACESRNRDAWTRGVRGACWSATAPAGRGRAAHLRRLVQNSAADLPGKFQDRSIKGSEFLLRSRGPIKGSEFLLRSRGQSPCSIKGSESLLDQWVRSRGQSPCSVKDSGWIGSKDSDPLIAWEQGL